jgi:hypothetical protein
LEVKEEQKNPRKPRGNPKEKPRNINKSELNLSSISI